MAMPLYIALGFSLVEIAAISKLVGFFATVIGALAGGLLTVRLGICAPDTVWRAAIGGQSV